MFDTDAGRTLIVAGYRADCGENKSGNFIDQRCYFFFIFFFWKGALFNF